MRRPDSVVLIAALMLTSLVSSPVLAAASFTLTANPSASVATSEDPAEYTITIFNDGDEDLTITLSTSENDGGCNGFTSNLESTVFSVDAGSTESTTLTVSISDQASGDCETTVSGTGVTSPPTEQDTADVKVTTT
ncbi:MAG: hypothetical protein CMA88_04595, partial [Euryarchaeota archaeon]|nr:hypothetical protein [Euryarchaeota archaeon]